MATTTTATTTTATSASSGTLAAAQLQKIKQDLSAALVAAGVTNAKASDPTPRGFPSGVSWNDAYRMVVRRVEDNDPATPGTLVIDAALVASNLKATQTLAQMGVTSLSRFPKGTSVTGAIDALYRDPTNGRVTTVLAQAGIYDLRAFPDGTSAFQAFKLVEDPNDPGKVSRARYADYKAATAALNTMDITTLVNFPRGTSVLEAKDLLEPKAAQMLKMVGVDKSLFKDPNISSLSAVATLMRLPETIRDMKALPSGQNAQDLARQAAAAKKLVALGYEDLSAFAGMKTFARQAPTPATALAAAQRKPALDDLPQPTAASAERLFQATNTTVKRTYGQPNPVTQSVFIPPLSEKVSVNPLPATRSVTPEEVLAFNRVFWQQRSSG